VAAENLPGGGKKTSTREQAFENKKQDTRRKEHLANKTGAPIRGRFPRARKGRSAGLNCHEILKKSFVKPRGKHAFFPADTDARLGREQNKFERGTCDVGEVEFREKSLVEPSQRCPGGRMKMILASEQ